MQVYMIGQQSTGGMWNCTGVAYLSSKTAYAIVDKDHKDGCTYSKVFSIIIKDYKPTSTSNN